MATLDGELATGVTVLLVPLEEAALGGLRSGELPIGDIISASSTGGATPLRAVISGEVHELTAQSYTITYVLQYIMRGYDTVLGKLVTWRSNNVDSTAAAYTIPANIDLATVVVFRLKGAQ